MADFFCDHGSTLYPTAYMSVPSGAGSFPQEGDGKASGTGAAPASAVAAMNFTGVTAAAGATLAVHGATLTCVASGAGANQFNAGNGATLAANIASAINAATAVPTTTTGGISPYLRALVWASASGAVLTVYTRIASADLNQAANSSCTLVCGTLGSWTSPPAAANFSGGVSGPWSRLFNPTALTAAVSAAVSGAATYGAWVNTTMGAPAGGGVVHIRTARGGSNIQITGIGSTSFTMASRAVGVFDSYVEYRFDNGVVWTGDNGVFSLVHDTAGQSPVVAFQGFTRLRGQMQSGTRVVDGAQPNFRLHSTLVNNAGWNTSLVLTSQLGARHCVVEGLEVLDAGLGTFASGGINILTSGNTTQTASTDGQRPVRLVDCKLGQARSAQSVFASTSVNGLNVEALDCLFAFGGATTYTQALVALSAFNVSASVRLVRPKFTGGGGGNHSMLPAFSNQSVAVVVAIEDPVDMGQFKFGAAAASLCGRVVGNIAMQFGMGDHALVQSINSENEFLLDTPRRLIEWRPAGFPTTSLSVLADGTPFTLRFSVPHTGLSTGLVTRMAPQRCIKQAVINTLGNTDLTLRQHILIDSLWGGSEYTPTDADWWIEGTYVDSTGAVRPFSTRGSGANLAADAQAWSSLSFAPFSGAARDYSRWLLTATLDDVKLGSVVTSFLFCAVQPQTMTEWCFVDPEFELVAP